MMPPWTADADRWRLTLERLWSRKLDEVIALTAASEGVSDADDIPAAAAMLPIKRLRDRADAAFDELGDLADAIARVHAGTYGRCADCGRLIADDWLAWDPATRCCPTCKIDGMLGSAVPQPRAADLQLSVPRQRAG
jgi:RNA polymerase-binding transcription factor DksA